MKAAATRIAAVAATLLLVTSPISPAVAAAPGDMTTLPAANVDDTRPSYAQGPTAGVPGAAAFRGSVMTTHGADTLQVDVTTKAAAEGRASACQQASGKPPFCTSPELALQFTDGVHHEGRRVAIPAAPVIDSLGFVPPAVHIRHSSGDTYTAPVERQGDLLVFRVENFSTNTVTFATESIISADPAATGASFSYDVRNLSAVDNYNISLTGHTNTEWDNETVTGVSAAASNHSSATAFNAATLANQTVSGSGDSATVVHAGLAVGSQHDDDQALSNAKELTNVTVTGGSVVLDDGIYTDGFEDGTTDGWTAQDGSSITTVTSPTHSGSYAMEVQADGDWTNYAEWMTISSSGNVTISAYAYDQSGDATEADEQFVSMQTGAGDKYQARMSVINDNVRIERVASDGTRTTLTQTSASLSYDTWYQIEFTRNRSTGDMWAVFKDESGNTIASLSGTDATYAVETVGVGSFRNAPKFDDVRVEDVQPDTGTYRSQNHSVDGAKQAAVNLTLQNASATLTVIDAGSGKTLNQTVVTTSGNHTLDLATQDTADLETNVAFDVTGDNPTAKTHDESILFTQQNEYASPIHSVEAPSTATVDLVLNSGADATITVSGSNATTGPWTTVNTATVSTSGTHDLNLAGTEYEHWRVNVSYADSTSQADDELQYETVYGGTPDTATAPAGTLAPAGPGAHGNPVLTVTGRSDAAGSTPDTVQVVVDGTTYDFGTLAAGETASKEVSLSTATTTLEWSFRDGEIDYTLALEEQTQTQNPAVEVNGHTMSYSGTLADGATTTLSPDTAWVQQGTNRVNVTVGSGLPADAPTPQVGLDYSHDTLHNQTVAYTDESLTERYTVSYTTATARDTLTLTIPFQNTVLEIRGIEYRVNESGGWSAVTASDYALANTELDVDLDAAYGGTVPTGTILEVRANGSRVAVNNATITVTDPTTAGDLDSTFSVDAWNADSYIRVDADENGSHVHYLADESWGSAEYARAYQSGRQRLYMPDAEAGDTARLRTIPLEVDPATDADIEVLEADASPKIRVSPGPTKDDTVQYIYYNTTSGETYELFSHTDSKTLDTADANSPVTLNDDDSDEILEIRLFSGTRDGGGGGGGIGGSIGMGPMSVDHNINLGPTTIVAILAVVTLAAFALLRRDGVPEWVPAIPNWEDLRR